MEEQKERNKENGLCVCCGNSAPIEGLTCCQKCRKRYMTTTEEGTTNKKNIDMCDLMCR